MSLHENTKFEEAKQEAQDELNSPDLDVNRANEIYEAGQGIKNLSFKHFHPTKGHSNIPSGSFSDNEHF